MLVVRGVWGCMPASLAPIFLKTKVRMNTEAEQKGLTGLQGMSAAVWHCNCSLRHTITVHGNCFTAVLR